MATHLYRNLPVTLTALTYQRHGQQYCTVRMWNRAGRRQNQTVRYDRLTPLPVIATVSEAPIPPDGIALHVSQAEIYIEMVRGALAAFPADYLADTLSLNYPDWLRQLADALQGWADEYLAVFPSLTYHVEAPTVRAGYDLTYDPGDAWFEFPTEYTLYALEAKDEL